MPLFIRPIHRINSFLLDDSPKPEWYNHLLTKASPEDLSQLANIFQMILATSPYLTESMEKEVGFLSEMCQLDIDSIFATLLTSCPSYESDAHIMQDLRQRKRRAALLIALADLAGWWDAPKITQHLSLFAEFAVNETCYFLLRKAIETGQIHPLTADNPAAGLIVLGMGKLGAYELNYSSDIDLILLFDPSLTLYCGQRSEQEFFNRLARDLVRILQDRTEDGYVFRTDLRLRPDPSSTPLVISTLAAEAYYESVGQNWERAAMIKARPIAGDIAVGEAYLSRLRPFLWRKHLDFAAVQDIHSIKRQIHAVKGHREINIAGHNIKLGRGGIREIEFFAQTQQLIWGGRMPDLRIRETCGALDALAKRAIITQEIADELKNAYWHLRHVEHRLQMQEDRQIHELPKGDNELKMLARFSGFANIQDFSRHLIAQMGIVEDHYAELFEEAPTLSAKDNLVFTGTDDDPQTLATIGSLGFSDSKTIAATIRGWHMGRYRAMRSARARELLTELIPLLLQSLSKTTDPDYAFHRFDTFLEQLPAGVQILSLLRANPHLLDLFAECLGDAPLLAERISHNPQLIEALLGLDRVTIEPQALAEDLSRQMGYLSHTEEKLSLLKTWSQELQFQAAYKFLHGDNNATQMGAHFSYIADQALRSLVELIEQDFQIAHGKFPGQGMAILALGRLGGREMTATSDLDLVFIYDLPDQAETSGGPKPLSPIQYFGRLSQRIIGALSATGLYQVDMRLRPSGNNGPIASALQAFTHYQNQEAWTWEHMALTKARCISGNSHFIREVESSLINILSQPRDLIKLREDILNMRRLVAKQHSPSQNWDIKHRFGGEMDLAFLAQYYKLAEARDNPAILTQSDKSLLTEKMPELGASYDFWQRFQQYTRLLSPDRAEIKRPGSQLLLAKLMGHSSFADLEREMEKTAQAIHTHFKNALGDYGAEISN